MAEYDNTNRGLLHRNAEKQEPNQPDFTGSINIDGREFWLNAWVKESPAGGKLKDKGIDKFFSLSVKAKDSKGGKTERPERPASASTDIPF